MDVHEAIAEFFGPKATMKVAADEGQAGFELRLYGSLDLDSSRRLQDLLSWIIDRQARQPRLIVDLGEVNYISSSGVGALTVGLSAARKRDIRFQIKNLQPKVRSIFVLLGLMGFFEEASPDA